MTAIEQFVRSDPAVADAIDSWRSAIDDLPNADLDDRDRIDWLDVTRSTERSEARRVIRERFDGDEDALQALSSVDSVVREVRAE